MKDYKLISVKTGREVPEKESVTYDFKDNSPLEVVYNYPKLKRFLNRYMFQSTPVSALKYTEFYPIHNLENLVSLNEGGTPLYESYALGQSVGVQKLFFKYEGTNPTGAFKDRGSMIEITKAKELGAKAIIVASTGNMAASVSAYSAKAGFECYIFVPEGTSRSKFVVPILMLLNLLNRWQKNIHSILLVIMHLGLKDKNQ
jgi:threonine synthase